MTEKLMRAKESQTRKQVFQDLIGHGQNFLLNPENSGHPAKSFKN